MIADGLNSRDIIITDTDHILSYGSVFFLIS